MAGNLTKAAATFWGSIIAQTWEDDAFKQKLIDNTEGTLREMGYGTFLDANGEKITIKVEEATSAASYALDEESKTLTLYLPEKPECLGQLELKGQFLTGICC